MHVKKKIHFILAILVLIALFPPIHNFFNEQGVEIQAKQSSIQASPIVITDNSEFEAAGFSTAAGTPEDPYILEDIVITSTGPPGINISNTDAHFHIKDVTISGSMDSGAGGIWLKNVKNGYITNVTVTGSNTGFFLEESSYNNLTGNNATGNKYDGIFMNLNCNHNRLTSNNVTGNGNGIYVSSSSNNTLIGNNCSGNNNILTSSYNIYLRWSDDCGLTGNIAKGNYRDGFLLDNCNNITLTNNNATEWNGRDGFYIFECNDITMINNKATENSNHGIYMEDTTFSTLTGNNASGNAGYGFYLRESDDNDLSNNTALENDSGRGFDVWQSHSNSLTGNTARGNTDSGFKVYYSSDNNLTGNNATGNNHGFSFERSDWNDLINCSATGNSYGIILNDSSNNSLINNNATDNTYGFYIESTSSTSSNNNLTGNNASGNDYGFWLDNSHNNTYSGNVASFNHYEGFYLSGSHNTSLTGNVANDNGQTGSASGFYIISSDNCTITGNSASGNRFGILQEDSSYNQFTSNNVSKNDDTGFYVYNSLHNNFTGNTASGTNFGEGLRLEGSCNFNFLVNNRVNGHRYGTFLENSHNNTIIDNIATDNENGFYIWQSSNNTFINNTVNNSTSRGLFFQSSSNNNTLFWNTICNSSTYGVYLEGCSGNLVYYNFFTDNNQGNAQGYDDSSSNSWDNGTHGNYWNDYTGIDTGNVGIGESNYTLAGGLQVNDTKPLVTKLQLTSSGNLDVEAGSTGIYNINWVPITNLLPAGYELYRDGELVGSGTWSSGSIIRVNVNVTGLALGTAFNFTLVVSDINRTVSDTIWVTVKDTTAPVITAPEDFTIEAGFTNTLSFTVTDLYPDTYILYKNGSVYQPGNWTSGTPFTVPLGTLSLGIHNFTLIVQDTSENNATCTVFVTVKDTTVPVIDYTGPDTITFEEGSTGNSLNATANDLYPGTYTVYQNGTVVLTGNWVSGTTITINLDDLEAGVYNYTLVVRDSSGNEAFLIVIITVTEPPASPPDLIGLLVVLSLIGAGGAAGFYFWRRSKRKK